MTTVLVKLLVLLNLYGIHGFCDVKQCVMKGGELSCRTCIPDVVPEGVIRVNVTNNTVPMTIQTFSDVSWRTLEYLDIIELDYVTVIIHGGTFSNLRSIKYLGLHLQLSVFNSSQIHNSAFDGLDDLDHLNLTNCVRFSFEVLFSLFKNQTNFSNLHQLSLGNFNRYGYGTHLSLNDSFLESLGKRRLEMLNVDDTHIPDFSLNPLNSICTSIRSVSARNAVITNVVNEHVLAPCTSLRQVDITGISVPITLPELRHIPTVTVNVTNRIDSIAAIYFFSNIELLYANTIYHGEPIGLHIRVILIIEIKCSFSLKHLSLQNNNDAYLDVELHTTLALILETLDISNNKLEYISPRFFGNMTSLRNISLAINCLQQMLENNWNDFENLFMHLKDLRMVDISNNELKSIPGNMFTRIQTLEYLLMSGNRLTSFSQQGYIVNLGYLDLRRNLIVSLDSKLMKWLDQESKRKRNETFYVDLQENPFHCSCDNIAFMEWLVHSDYVIKDIPLTCDWKRY